MAGFRARAEGRVETRLVPYPALTLVIDLGEELLVHDAAGQSKHGSVAAGIAPGSIHGGGRSIECLQMRFSPVAAYGVFGNAAELSGNVVALDDLWGPEAGGFEEQLSAARSWDARFALVMADLRHRGEAQRAVDPEIAVAWHQLTTSHGLIRIADLSSELGWSRKRLWSRFTSQVGLTPKRAAELVRFDHAALRLAAGHSPARVAADCGYADQSHLHREVRAVAGLTPSAIAKAPWLAVVDIAWTSERA